MSVRPSLSFAAAALAVLLPMPLPAAPPAPFATGAGTLHIDGEFRNFAFTGHRAADGTVRGVAELHNRTADIRLHMRIDCMRIVGNVATFSGRHLLSTDPTYVDQPFWFRVVDNGERAGDPDDEMTLVATFFGVGPTCDDDYPLPLMPIEGGNIQVRP